MNMEIEPMPPDECWRHVVRCNPLPWTAGQKPWHGWCVRDRDAISIVDGLSTEDALRFLAAGVAAAAQNQTPSEVPK